MHTWECIRVQQRTNEHHNHPLLVDEYNHAALHASMVCVCARKRESAKERIIEQANARSNSFNVPRRIVVAERQYQHDFNRAPYTLLRPWHIVKSNTQYTRARLSVWLNWNEDRPPPVWADGIRISRVIRWYSVDRRSQAQRTTTNTLLIRGYIHTATRDEYSYAYSRPVTVSQQTPANVRKVKSAQVKLQAYSNFFLSWKLTADAVVRIFSRQQKNNIDRGCSRTTCTHKLFDSFFFNSTLISIFGTTSSSSSNK